MQPGARSSGPDAASETTGGKALPAPSPPVPHPSLAAHGSAPKSQRRLFSIAPPPPRRGKQWRRRSALGVGFEPRISEAP
eukprot:9499467-Pyramimonas_sp.AAC.1